MPKPWEKYAEPRALAPTVREKLSAAELDAKYRQAQRDRLEMERLQKTPIPQPTQPRETPGEKARGAYLGEIGTSTAKVEFNLPKLERVARDAIREGAALVKHPGFEAAVGMPNPFKGGLGIGTLPASPARGFTNRLDKVKSGAFLSAFESLKGAGAITEQEGAKATAAMAAMDTATTESDFKAALQDYLNVVAGGVQTAREQVKIGRSKIGDTSGNPMSYDNVMAELRRRAAARQKGK